MLHRYALPPAASAVAQPPMGTDAVCTQHAVDGGAAASLFDDGGDRVRIVGDAVVADARQPQPEFRHLIKMLANPPLFRATDSDALKAAKTRIADVFGDGVELDAEGNGYFRKGAR